MSALAEEILSVLAKKGRIATTDIQDSFNVTKETARMALDFLMKFGFVELDKSKKYILLSEPCQKFFAEAND
ncbi:MAG: DeoR family transcriptional regulator [Nitrososphaerales archaeon]